MKVEIVNCRFVSKNRVLVCGCRGWGLELNNKSSKSVMGGGGFIIGIIKQLASKDRYKGTFKHIL